MYSEDLVKKIKLLYERHQSFSLVAKTLGMYPSTVMRIIKRNSRDQNETRGRPKKIDKKTESRLMRKVQLLKSQKKRCTAVKLKDELGLNNVSLRTIHRTLRRNDLKYSKAKLKPVLSKKHKDARVDWAKKRIRENLNWKMVVFSDEKRFTLDGPDSWSTWMREDEEMIRAHRQNKGGGIMIFGIVTSNGFLWVKELKGKVNSTKYIELLSQHVKPVLDEHFHGENYFFQQDNCPIHVSAQSKRWFNESNFHVIDWPSRSPDLNIIENVWSMMSNIIYSENSHFSRLDELRTAVDNCVDFINQNKQNCLKKLFDSIPDRLINVISSKGKTLKY